MSNDKIKNYILISTPLIGILGGYIADVSNSSGNNLGAFLGFILGLGALLVIVLVGSIFDYIIRNKNTGRLSLLGYFVPWLAWVIYMVSASIQLSGFILT